MQMKPAMNAHPASPAAHPSLHALARFFVLVLGLLLTADASAQGTGGDSSNSSSPAAQAPGPGQPGTIIGRVVDAATGESLPGATIAIVGASQGATAGADGSYRIENIQPGIYDVQASFIGYQSQTVEDVPVTADEVTVLDFSLESGVSALDEVVVVGYGEQRKVNLTGAVSTINFDDALENRPVTNASQALSGKVTGVWVSQNSGAPGSDGATLRVRGFGTLNDTNPLVIIDGVEGRLAELNPNDIASMTVLKDAASAAIYGARAANGVVLVTTKRGDYNSAPQVSYNGYYGVQNLGMRYDLIDNSAEFMEMWNTAVMNNGGDPLFPQDVIEAFRTGTDPYKYPNVNYFDEVFQSAPITEHNVSVRGGSADANYYISANYLDQGGIIRQTNSNRYGVHLNLNTRVTDWLEVGGTLRGMRKITDRPYDDIGRIMYMMSNGGYPFIAPYTRDGRFGATQAVYLSGPNAGMPIVDSRNPLPDAYNGQTQYTNSFLEASLNATLRLLPGLSLNARYSDRYNNNRQDRYNEMHYVYTDEGFRSTTLDYPSVINNYRSANEEVYRVFYNTLNFDHTFGERHNTSAILGMQAEALDLSTTAVRKSDPPKDGLHEVDAGTSSPFASGNSTEWRMLSYFGRLNYNFDEKYLFESNLRADASSRFKSGNRWGLFPSFSAGWRISEEPFMRGLDFISELKLRASWGRLGNQNIEGIAGNYPYLISITQNYGTSYNFGGQLMPGAAVTSLVDEDITWETTESIDIGLDLGLLNNRLNLELDYFNKQTSDILVRLPIPQILGGVSAPVENVGRMRNDGFEVAASYQSDSYNRDFSYRIGANLSYVTNEVTKFRGGQAPDQLYLIREGISYRALYGYNAIGIYRTDEEAAEHMANNSYIPEAGDLKYEDVNGDGRLDYRDKQVLGNTIPKYTYGINLGLTYKNLNLDVVTMGIAGAHAYTANAWTQPLGISGGTITTRWRDAWTPENPDASLPRIRINDTWNRYESSFWVTDISFFKIKNIQLSYNLPSRWLQRMNVDGLSIYLNVQNLPAFVTDDYEGFDPERSTFDSGASLYPTPVTTSIGVNVQL